jgi:hypothetical protein
MGTEPATRTRRGSFGRKRRIRVGIAVVAAALVGSAGVALAVDPPSGVATYTACLTGGGQLTDVAVGTAAPLHPCHGNDVVVHLSGGTITSVTAGTGLVGGGTNGAVTLGLAPGFALPQSCAADQVPEWNGTAWGCASQASYTNGTGLDLTGNALSIDPAYRLPQACAPSQVVAATAGGWQCASAPTYSAGAGVNLSGTTFSVAPAYQLPQNCGTNDVARWNGSTWTCSQAASAAPDLYHVFTFPPPLNTGGRATTPVASLTVPAGTYQVVAHVDVDNFDGDTQNDDCFLTANGNHYAPLSGSDSAGGTLSAVGDGGSTGNWPLVGTATFSSDNSTIGVSCDVFNASVAVSLSAERVGALH